MSIALVAHTIAGSANGNGFTSSAIDTTGASILVVLIADQFATTVGTVSDSKGNTWTKRTTYGSAATNPTVRITAFYAANPTVGSGHTFTYTGTSTFGALSASGWIGADPAAPYDVENGAFNNAAGFDTSVGDVSPAGNGELLVTGSAWHNADPDSGNMTVTSGGSYIPLDAHNHDGNSTGLAVAYLIQTTGAASNVTWHNAGASWVHVAATTTAFIPTGGGGPSFVAPNSLIVRQAVKRASFF